VIWWGFNGYIYIYAQCGEHGTGICITQNMKSCFFFKKVENLPPIVANCMAKSKDKPQEFEVLIVWTKP
jgi:hypothetical protein